MPGLGFGVLEAARMGFHSTKVSNLEGAAQAVLKRVVPLLLAVEAACA